MGWSQPIDAYCERLSPDFWAEPLNAVSNVAFLIAAILAARLVLRERRDDAGLWLLVGLVGVIGVGSFLFHTFATRWAVLADVLPITIFIHAYLYLAMRRFFGLPWWGAALVTLGFLLLSTAADALAPPGVLNGSLGYVPALLALVVTGGLLLATGRSGGAQLLGVAAIFLVSLSARTADAAVCTALPIGLHYAWHALNAVVLYLLVRTLLRHGAGSGPHNGAARHA